MKDKILFLTDLLLPMIETGASFLSIDPSLSMVSPMTQAYLTPIKAILHSMSELEKDRVKYLLDQLSKDVHMLKEKDLCQEFLMSPDGQDLVKAAILGVSKTKGINRIQVISKITSNGYKTSNLAFTAKDAIDIISELSEVELNILFRAYELFPNKELISKPRKDSVSGMKVLEWTDLHKSFPGLPPLELLAFFHRMQRTGLVSREQGFMGDDGSSYEFTPIFMKVLNIINLKDKE